MNFYASAVIEARHTRKDHEIKFQEAVKWSVFYVSAALLFAIPIFVFVGAQAGSEYLAAWALSWGLGGILGWISFKMMAAPLGLHVSIGLSLAVLGVLLFGSIFASILWEGRKPSRDIGISKVI